MALGKRDRLRPRRGRPQQIDDPRTGGLIPGVANRDARAVFEARCERLEHMLADADAEPAAARALCEAQRMGLWRAGRFTSFDAWAEARLGLTSSNARELAERGAEAQGSSLERLPEPLVALWLRAEAVLLQQCPGAQLEVRGEGPSATLRLQLPLQRMSSALEALDALGASAANLMRVLQGRAR